MIDAVVSSKALAETLSYWATTAGIIIALAAGLGAYWKHVKDRRDREWDRARDVYGKFIDLAMRYPEFVPGFWSKRDKSDVVQSTKFYWFMSHHLWACEEILLNLTEKDAWHESLKINLRWHADYLSSEEFEGELAGYFPPVQKLVLEIIEERRRQSPGGGGDRYLPASSAQESGEAGSQ